MIASDPGYRFAGRKLVFQLSSHLLSSIAPRATALGLGGAEFNPTETAKSGKSARMSDSDVHPPPHDATPSADAGERLRGGQTLTSSIRPMLRHDQ
jgi:hypothetical protein